MKTYITKNINGIEVKIEKELLYDTRLNFNELTKKTCEKILSINKQIIDENTIRFLYFNPVFEYTFYIQAQYDLTGFNNRYLYIENCEY